LAREHTSEKNNAWVDEQKKAMMRKVTAKKLRAGKGNTRLKRINVFKGKNGK